MHSQSQGWGKGPVVDPELLAASSGYDSVYEYDPNLVVRGTSAFQNPTFQAGWPRADYMTPISQLSRSSHAQGSAWGPAH